MPRNVKGVLFADYVRMVRGQKNVDWGRHLEGEDMRFLVARVEPDRWYPMTTFERLGNAISVTELAEASGLSESHFRQRFHQEMGISPSDFIARRRVQKAKGLLKSSELSITEIAFQLGFQSSPYFAAVFKKLTGQTPSQFREGGGD